MRTIEFQRRGGTFQFEVFGEVIKSELELKRPGLRCWGVKQDNKSCFQCEILLSL